MVALRELSVEIRRADEVRGYISGFGLGKQFFEQIEEFLDFESRIESLKKKKVLKRHVKC